MTDTGDGHGRRRRTRATATDTGDGHGRRARATDTSDGHGETDTGDRHGQRTGATDTGDEATQQARKKQEESERRYAYEYENRAYTSAMCDFSYDYDSYGNSSHIIMIDEGMIPMLTPIIISQTINDDDSEKIPLRYRQ